jgi:hypothetical protein
VVVDDGRSGVDAADPVEGDLLGGDRHVSLN